MKLMNPVVCLTLLLGTQAAFAADTPAAQWDAGMDDDAGKAAATSRADLPAADYEGARQIYPKRDRLYTTSLDGTWAFRLAPGLETPDDLKGWEQPGYDVSDWDDIAVPGNWETQGLKAPQYGNQIDEITGYYVRRFRWQPQWEGQRVILRFDGVLFGYEVWVNGRYVGRWGSAFNLAQWDVTDKLVKGRNTIAVKVMTRAHGWLFDTNDCWCLAGIFRSVELFTVPNDYIEDVVFRTEDVRQTGLTGLGEDSQDSAQVSDGNPVNQEGNPVNPVEKNVPANISVIVKAGAFDGLASRARRVYISLVDEDGIHVLDFDWELTGGRVEVSGTVEKAHLWSAESPYLYTLVVTLVDAEGRKIERIAEPQGIRTVRLVDKHLEINGEPTFLKGVAWNEIDPVLGRAITETERRKQMSLMKKAGVNCIRTAHYPFGPDFLRLADEMGFYVIDEVPFGSRGSMYLKNRAYRDELLTRTEATMRRDKNHASVIFWTFGNENTFTPNTKDVLAYAKAKDSTRPRGLPQIGSSQAKETMYHPERDVDFIAAHYLNPENMREYEKNTTKPIVQTEFAHACGNGFCDFEDRLARMQARPDVWMGGCVWAWIDQSVMHPDSGEQFERELSLSRVDGKNKELPKDMRRDLPRQFQGNYVDPLHFIDSWGDRATDGVVYGDGTPKDGYWLVKALYAGRKPTGRIAPDAPKITMGWHTPLADATGKDGEEFLLRVGRKLGLDQQIQTLTQRKSFRHDPYLVTPQVLAFEKGEKSATWTLRWPIDGKEEQFIEGTVAATEEPDGKIRIDYDLKPSEKCLKYDQFTELGLTLSCGGTRVDWAGLGPLTSVPGKSKMNADGLWSMHKDDYRFPGNRAGVKWVATGENGREAVFVLESGTGNVAFESLDGRIALTENLTVAGYGGKGGGPNALKLTKDIEMKGSFRVYEGAFPAPRPDVVPDLTYTHHYGF